MTSAGGADLSHIDTWLFDLDNTLYPPDSGLAARVDAQLTEYMVGLTGLPAAEALALQKHYLEEHGVTLIGRKLVRYAFEPDEVEPRIEVKNAGALSLLKKDFHLIATAVVPPWWFQPED